MKKVVGLVFLAAACATSQRFGAAPSLPGPPLSLEQALTPGHVGQTIAIRGRVAEVCQEMGCWMVLTGGTRSVRATFKEHAFTVYKDLAGASVVAEGVLSFKTVSEEMRRHYAEDAGRSPEQVAAIRGPADEYSFVADSVVTHRK